MANNFAGEVLLGGLYLLFRVLAEIGEHFFILFVELGLQFGLLLGSAAEQQVQKLTLAALCPIQKIIPELTRYVGSGSIGIGRSFHSDALLQCGHQVFLKIVKFRGSSAGFVGGRGSG